MAEDTKEKKIKYYNVSITSGVYAISLVEDPAIEVDFIALSKEYMKRVIHLDSDKHIVTGPVLIPDKPIYRKQDGEEFYIQFSKETIEHLAHNFLERDRTHSFTEEHDHDVDCISVVESWIDGGDPFFGTPEGTWMIAAKVNDDDLWQRIKDGELKGFSIEAFADLDEIMTTELNKVKNDNEMIKGKRMKTKMEAIEVTDSFWDKLKSILADALGKGEESKEVEDTVGEIVDAMEVDGGTKDEEPKVIENDDEETPSEAVDTAVEDTVETIADATDTPAEEADALQAVIDGLQEEIAKKDEEIEQLKKANAKMGKKPSVKPNTKMGKQKQNPRDIIEALYNGTYFNK